MDILAADGRLFRSVHPHFQCVSVTGLPKHIYFWISSEELFLCNNRCPIIFSMIYSNNGVTRQSPAPILILPHLAQPTLLLWMLEAALCPTHSFRSDVGRLGHFLRSLTSRHTLILEMKNPQDRKSFAFKVRSRRLTVSRQQPTTKCVTLYADASDHLTPYHTD